jgi:hypothetical protein
LSYSQDYFALIKTENRNYFLTKNSYIRLCHKAGHKEHFKVSKVCHDGKVIMRSGDSINVINDIQTIFLYSYGRAFPFIVGALQYPIIHSWLKMVYENKSNNVNTKFQNHLITTGVVSITGYALWKLLRKKLTKNKKAKSSKSISQIGIRHFE